MAQCEGKTRSGARCKLDATVDSRLCATHKVATPTQVPHPEETRTITQVEWCGEELIALCDDGTMWMSGGGTGTGVHNSTEPWVQVPGPEHMVALSNRHMVHAELRNLLQYDSEECDGMYAQVADILRKGGIRV